MIAHFYHRIRHNDFLQRVAAAKRFFLDGRHAVWNHNFRQTIAMLESRCANRLHRIRQGDICKGFAFPKYFVWQPRQIADFSDRHQRSAFLKRIFAKAGDGFEADHRFQRAAVAERLLPNTGDIRQIKRLQRSAGDERFPSDFCRNAIQTKRLQFAAFFKGIRANVRHIRCCAERGQRSCIPER